MARTDGMRRTPDGDLIPDDELDARTPYTGPAGTRCDTHGARRGPDGWCPGCRADHKAGTPLPVTTPRRPARRGELTAALTERTTPR